MRLIHSSFVVLLCVIGCDEPFSSGTGGNGGNGGSGGSGGGGASVSTEPCDGMDNDDDGIVDEGCPSSIELTGQTVAGHALFGEAGGLAFTSECPDGFALGELKGSANTRFNIVQGVCFAMNLDFGAVAPFEYSIRRGAEEELQWHGAFDDGDDFSLSCNGDDFIVGIDGKETFSGAVGSLTVHCAPLLVVEANGAFQIEFGPVYTSTFEATGLASTPFVDVLTAPKVVNHFRGTEDDGTNGIAGIGIGEATVTLRLIPDL